MWAYARDMKNNDLPTTSNAEKWLDADHFIYKGNIWVVDIDGVVKLEKGVGSVHGKPNNKLERSEQLTSPTPNP